MFSIEIELPKQVILKLETRDEEEYEGIREPVIRMQFCGYVETLNTPSDLLGDTSYFLGTNDKDTSKWLTKFYEKNSVDPSNNVSLSSILLSESKRSSCYILYFEKVVGKVEVVLQELQVGDPLLKIITNEESLQKYCFEINALNVTSLHELTTLQILQISNLKPDTLKRSKSSMIDQILSQKTSVVDKKHSPEVSLSLLKQKQRQERQEQKEKVRLTLQRVVLSGLRLYGITQSSKEYQQIYYHTLKALEFAFRKDIAKHTLPSIEVQQSAVESLLNIFLRDYDES